MKQILEFFRDLLLIVGVMLAIVKVLQEVVLVIYYNWEQKKNGNKTNAGKRT